MRINFFGAAIMALILIPNIIYAVRQHDLENKCKNKLINLAEQIGRFGSMLFMSVIVDFIGYGFSSDELFAVWLVSNAALLAGYFIFWLLYFKRSKMLYAIMLAVIPSIIFIYAGLSQQYIPLLCTGIIFAPAHIYITYINNKGAALPCPK